MNRAEKSGVRAPARKVFLVRSKLILRRIRRRANVFVRRFARTLINNPDT